MKKVVLGLILGAAISAEASSHKKYDENDVQLLKKVGMTCPLEFAEAMKYANNIESVVEIESRGPDASYEYLTIETVAWYPVGGKQPRARLVITTITPINEQGPIAMDRGPQSKVKCEIERPKVINGKAQYENAVN